MAELKTGSLNAERETAPGKRRSHRIHIAMAVLVRGKSRGAPFEEMTNTVTVNACGGMLLLTAQLERGQQISVVNPQTQEEVPCIVTFLGKKEGDKSEVGIEFAEPSALFWRINFPPLDWDPEERKRPGGHSQQPAITPRR